MGGRGWFLALVSGVLGWTAGCVPPGRAGAAAPEGWSPTLLVESASVEHVAVRVNGLRVGTITRGRSCIRIPAVSGSVRLDFVSLSGRASAPEPLYLTPGSHWRLVLGPGSKLGRDVQSLGRVDRGCAPGSVRPRR